MSLTTPVPRDQDAVFPGENWFFYWKTSASLWKSKLREFPGTKIIVPINWSFHSETGDQVDFDEHRPETNLRKLVEIANEVGKSVVFFLPITPAPYLANGGVPHFLARNLSLTDEGLAYGIIDADDHLVKIYSLFDPRVFESYFKFVQKLGEYFFKNSLKADLWAIRCGYFEDGVFKSYLDDSSKAFEMAFARFLKSQLGADVQISSVEQEQLKFEFNKNISSLYETNIKEALPKHYEGTLDVAFLGGSNKAFFKKLSGAISTIDYTSELYEALAKDIIPSSVLLSNQKKTGVLSRELNDLVANSYLPSRLVNSASLDSDEISLFRPLSFFKVYEKVDGISSLFQNWNELALWPFLKTNFGWSYKIISSDTLKLHDTKTPYQENIHLFHGHDVDKTIFNFILKMFINGGRIILNKSGLSEEYTKRFETFFLENNLQVEKVTFQTKVENIALGEGRLVLIDGEGFENKDPNTMDHFWKTLIATFSLINIQIQNSEGIDYYWRTRQTAAHELRFEEVRRLSLYNPTSYRKRIKMSLNKNFVVYKVIDEINVIVQTYPNEIEIELSPEGSVIVDFGVFS